MRSFTFSLTLRFAALVSGTTLALLVLVGALLEVQGLHSLELLQDGEFTELSLMLRTDSHLTGKDIDARIGQDTNTDAGLFFTEIHTLGGETLFRSSNLGATTLPEYGKPGEHLTVNFPGYGDIRISYYQDSKFRYSIASALAPFHGIGETYRHIALLVFVGTSALGIVLGYGFARLTQRPLRLIREAALAINADNLGRRIPLPEGKDELAALTTLLNQMFDRLQSAFEQNRRFTADASHELKTPLSVIRLHAEKLRPALQNDPASLELLEDLLEESMHLHQVIEGILFLAKTESGTLAVPFGRHPISEVLMGLEDDARVLADDAGVRIHFQAEGDFRLHCEKVLLHQMAMNLLSNAIRHCPGGGLVDVHSTAEAGQWRLVIRDEGPGVDPKMIERMFERFQRLGSTTGTGKTLTRDGHGLGLAIAKGVAKLHGGTITARNRTDRSGLEVTIELPLQ